MLTFLGIGAQKCGTTWLYEMLKLHPQVAFPMGKEMHFWNKQYVKGVPWYRNSFLSPDKVEGEITPAYAILPVEVIREIYKEFPEIRLMMVIRNPMERAWSSAKMALLRAEMQVSEASDQWFIDHFHSAGSKMRGDYERCIKNWRQAFPEDRLMLMMFDEVKQNPKRLLKSCCEHLQIDPTYFETVPDESLLRPVFSSLKEPVRESLMPILASLYSDQIDSLSEYLKSDLANWKRGYQ